MVNRHNDQEARLLRSFDNGWHESERLRGFCDRQTDRQMDICNCRVAFATENTYFNMNVFEGVFSCCWI